MLKISKQKVSRNKFPIALLTIELITAALVVYLFYKLLGLKFSFEEKTISIAPNADPMLLFLFVLSAALLVAIYLATKKKVPELLEAQELAKGTIKNKTKEKLARAKDEPRAAALLLIQLLFVMAVVITIVAWVDPQLELIQWEKLGIVQPLTTILNGIIALVGLAFFYYLYSFTVWYRK